MSFRPTIALYFRGEIADIWYCKNRDVEYLLYDAVRLYLEYRDCPTAAAYRARKYGKKLRFTPRALEEERADLKTFESLSEYPLIVDVTARCIYVNEGPLSPTALRARPSVFDGRDPIAAHVDRRTDFYDLLERYVLPLDGLDPALLESLLSPQPDDK